MSLGPISLEDNLKNNATRSSTLKVQNQLWNLNQDALRVRNISKMGSLSLVESQDCNTRSTPSGCAFMMMKLSKRNGK